MRLRRLLGVLLIVITSAPATAVAGAPDVIRATVQIRNGDRRGSGTIVASSPGLTYVLTAAHVIRGTSDPQIELHRHNVGPAPAVLTEGGGWPRIIPGTVVASDAATDVALLKVVGMVALRHVARIDAEAVEPSAGESLISIGIDRGRYLTRWKTGVAGAAMVDIKQGGDGPRRFILTEKSPEHGRSGGGLFRPDGTLIGVCTGLANPEPGRARVGIFASTANVLRVLREGGLIPALSGEAAGR